MKKFASAVLLLAVSASSFAVSYDRIALPERFGNTFISDSADILSADNERRLDADLISYYEATGTQIAVFTTQDTNGSPTPKDFANKLFERLALGEKDVDNGLLILLSIDDRRVEFETGYGLEGSLPDVTQSRIQKQLMIPSFKKGDYEQGLLDGTYATMSVLDAAAILEGRSSTEKQSLAGDNSPTSENLDALSESAKATIKETPKTLTSAEAFRKLIRLGFFICVGFLIIGIYKFWSRQPKEREVSSKAEKLVPLMPVDNTPRPPVIITRCLYCSGSILETDKKTDLNITMKTLHFSFYERKITAAGMATIDIYKCPTCSFINKVYHTAKPITNCHVCSSKSVYCLSRHSNNLSNHLNVYRDRLARTIPLQSIRFKSVSSKWRENSSILLIINHCFICNDMTQNIGEVAIPHAPSKPRPQAPRKVAHVESPPKPKGAVSSSARPSSRPSTTLGSSARSHSASIARKRSGGSSSVPKSKKSKPAPTRKRGGRSGGGGAGSSW